MVHINGEWDLGVNGVIVESEHIENCGRETANMPFDLQEVSEVINAICAPLW